MSKPLIGITPSYDYNENRVRISDFYHRGVEAAGGLPVILPVPSSLNTLESIISKLDGILFSGGTDIDPKHFGENTLPQNGEVNPYRDETELFLAKLAFQRNLPALGICRGVQIMNIALGGTIYQDIQTQYQGEHIKHSQSAPSWYPCHKVIIKKESKLFNILDQGEIEVNSFHHQALKQIAKDFQVSATSPDGITEAIESPFHQFYIGVQWHPELMWEKSSHMLKLFEAFVSSATQGCCSKINFM